ncbi:hypothetical protein QBC47DRAFT_460403 [Echria macrotheca]|uniref:Uncharacterized protein n=1 Tax=Echria macrotheca TaxID=438768 RepID=A0AAJ0BCL5_9PEZI|nr:hypothetical protein QBC47DRAFT_460403 [Echria macrotheca]
MTPEGIAHGILATGPDLATAGSGQDSHPASDTNPLVDSGSQSSSKETKPKTKPKPTRSQAARKKPVLGEPAISKPKRTRKPKTTTAGKSQSPDDKPPPPPPNHPTEPTTSPTSQDNDDRIRSGHNASGLKYRNKLSEGFYRLRDVLQRYSRGLSSSSPSPSHSHSHSHSPQALGNPGMDLDLDLGDLGGGGGGRREKGPAAAGNNNNNKYFNKAKMLESACRGIEALSVEREELERVSSLQSSSPQVN